MDLEAMKTKVQAEIDKYQDEFWQTAEYIHANPELRFEEFKAAKALCDLLENHGFEVQRGYCELPTAFRAVKEGKAGGPTIGLLCEYDALVEIGHACGHNLIGTISAAAGIAVSSILEEVAGKIVVLGTPAEEGGGGKVLILNRGGMDDLDCAMIIHPTDKTMVDDVSLANSEITFRFTGKSAHAAAYPQEGVNALEAVIATFNNINGIRLNLPKDASVHGIITKGGIATNIITENAECMFSVRAMKRSVLNVVLEKVKNCARAAALSTGCSLEMVMSEGHNYDEIDNNVLMKELLHKNFDLLGEPVAPRLADKGMGSTDMGNVTLAMPGFQAYIGLGEGAVTHTPEFAQFSTGETGYHALITAAKALAMTTVDLLAQPELVEQAKAEFQASKEDK